MPHLMPRLWWDHEAVLAELVRSPLFQPGLLVRWTAQNILLSIPVWAADLLFGAAVLQVLERRGGGRLPAPLRAAAALAIGSGLGGLLLFLLGSAHLLSRTAILAATAAAGVAGALILHRFRGWRSLRVYTRLLRPRRPGLRGLALGALFGFLIVVLLADLMLPVMEFDSAMYHMRAARHYLETGSISYDATIRYNAHPHLSVLLYMRHWAALGEHGLVKLANIEFLLMLVLVLVYAARELRWKDGWTAGLMFVMSSPLFLFVAHLEYADLALAAYFAVAAALLFHLLRHGGRTALVAGGLVLGFTGAVKLQGLVLAACGVAGFTLAWLYGRRGLAALVRALALIGALVALSGAGWWLRSWVNTGSPAFPFFAGSHPDAVATFIVNRSYGAGHDWRAFLLLPWHMLTGPAWKFADPAVFGIAGLVLLAALAGAALMRRAKPAPGILFLAATCAAFTLFWFHTGQVMRYLTSILALMAMLFLWALARMGAARRRWVADAVTWLLAVAVVYESLIMSFVFRRAVLPPVTYAQNAMTLAGGLTYYGAVTEINRRAADSEKTYLLFCEECGFHLKTGSAGDWHGDYSYGWLRDGSRSAAEAVALLKGAGFRWVLVSRGAAQRSARIFSWSLAESAFLRDGAELPGARAVHSDSAYAVFQLW